MGCLFFESQSLPNNLGDIHFDMMVLFQS